MLAAKAEPTQVAQAVVHLLTFAMSFSANDQLKAHIGAFIVNPEEGFDKIAVNIPQLTDPEYKANLKEAIIEAIEDYMAEVQEYQERAAEEEEEDLYEGDEAEDTPEAQAPEEDSNSADQSVVTTAANQSG